MSSQTTTQNDDSAHARHLIAVAMPSTADKRYNDAAVEPDNTGHVSDERPSHNVGNIPVGRDGW
ncbi:hypothetical protein [Dendronalium sp. ChiSLP03b]|uniref:hypothetical protein n=1 Tax=Dendronalium sp. ChiSLP03b TaxID=3075381 RepID=UPI002AD44B94|nr:hypothetical protein [Dendronalium sp. ChiSLP03b]MDZ8206955.1 hypothetical protein [Dendronalium sp. ChiSLP03b]